MGNFNPKNPTKFRGTDKNITFFVSRNRRPTLADYRQPETGNLYSVGTVWQIGKDPTTGLEGDLWMLSKIVANQGYWIEISGGGGAGLVNEFTTDDMLTVLPDALGNVNVFGLGETSTQGNIANTIGILSPRTAKFVVDPTLNNGTHQTITAAMSDASSGDTIFIRPGTYTEDVVCKSGVNLVAYASSLENPSVEIIGKLSFLEAGTSDIYNIKLTTNGDYSIDMTGSNATYVRCYGCFINTVDNNSINYAVTNVSSGLMLSGCIGNISLNTITLFEATGTGIVGNFGSIYIKECIFRSSANTTIPSISTACQIAIYNSRLTFPLSISASGTIDAYSTYFNTQNQNTTSVALAGTGDSSFKLCSFTSGSATALTIDAGVNCQLKIAHLSSSNVDVISGTGTLWSDGLSFGDKLYGSSNVNVTTWNIMKEGPSRIIGSANVGGSNVLTTTNTDNTNASSDAAIIASVGGSSAGDPYIQYSVGSTRSYCTGIDNSFSDSYNLNTDTSGTVTPSSGTNLIAIGSQGGVTINGQANGSNTGHVIKNINNTANSGVNVRIVAAGSSAGDAWSRYAIEGVTEYSLGVDNSDSDALCLTNTNTLNGTNYMRVSSAGEFNYPLQPAFLAYLTTSVTDVSGDGTEYTIIYDTEVFDQNSDFNLGTSTFTAPVTGKYQINVQGSLIGGTILSAVILRITTSNRTYRITLPTNAAVTSTASQGASVLADMDAADTFTITIQSTDTAGKVDDVAGTTGGQLRNWVSAQLSV